VPQRSEIFFRGSAAWINRIFGFLRQAFPIFEWELRAEPSLSLHLCPFPQRKADRMTRFASLFIAPLALLVLPAMADAQTARTICAERDQIVGTLTGYFGETARSWGMGPAGRIVEIFASDETGTWTITVTAPDGTTCLVASGNSWEDLARSPAGEAT
jgi:hypothetical protein